MNELEHIEVISFLAILVIGIPLFFFFDRLNKIIVIHPNMLKCDLFSELLQIGDLRNVWDPDGLLEANLKSDHIDKLDVKIVNFFITGKETFQYVSRSSLQNLTIRWKL